MTIPTSDRYTRARPCPICGGFGQAERGTENHCSGYSSADKNGRRFANCTNRRFAEKLERDEATGSFGHLLDGNCRCGATHTAPPPANPVNSNQPDSQRWIAETYDYHSEEGKRIFQVVRYEPKGFSQRRPNGMGGWIWNLEGVKPVPYRLPELLGADPALPVFVVEGEKDVDRLRSNGLVATCNAMGAGKWRDEYSQYLTSRDVIIIPDNDQPGRNHADQVARSLTGIAKSVRIIRLPCLPEKGDVSDWLDIPGNEASAFEGTAVTWTPLNTGPEQANSGEGAYPRPQPERSSQKSGGIAEALRKIKTGSQFDAMEFEPPRWFVAGLIRQGATIIAAKEKTGKTRLLLNLAKAVVSGEDALGCLPVQQCKVLYLGLEMNGGELKEITDELFPNGTPDDLRIITQEDEWPVGDIGLSAVEAWVDQQGGNVMVIIDTLTLFRPERRKGADLMREDYQLASSYKKSADQRRAAYVFAHHTNKGNAADMADRINATRGLGAGVSALIEIERNRAEAEAKIRTTGKGIKEQVLEARFEGVHWRLKDKTDIRKITPEREAVLKLLRQFPNGLHYNDIASQLEIKPGTARKRLFDMCTAGLVTQCGEGRYKIAGNNSNKPVDEVDLPHYNGLSESYDLSELDSNKPVTGSNNGNKEQRKLLEAPTFVTAVTPVTACYDCSDYNSNKDFSDCKGQKPILLPLLPESKYSASMQRLAEAEGSGNYQAVLNLAGEVHESGELSREEKANFNIEVSHTKQRMTLQASA